jgi:hypothetical protein
MTSFEIHEDEFRKYLPEEKDSCIVKKPVTIKELVNTINEKLAEPLYVFSILVILRHILA